jgi:hypothetical protein
VIRYFLAPHYGCIFVYCICVLSCAGTSRTAANGSNASTKVTVPNVVSDATRTHAHAASGHLQDFSPDWFCLWKSQPTAHLLTSHVFDAQQSQPVHQLPQHQSLTVNPQQQHRQVPSRSHCL